MALGGGFRPLDYEEAVMPMGRQAGACIPPHDRVRRLDACRSRVEFRGPVSYSKNKVSKEAVLASLK
jgi:hypothetical protein